MEEIRFPYYDQQYHCNDKSDKTPLQHYKLTLK